MMPQHRKRAATVLNDAQAEVAFRVQLSVISLLFSFLDYLQRGIPRNPASRIRLYAFAVLQVSDDIFVKRRYPDASGRRRKFSDSSRCRVPP